MIFLYKMSTLEQMQIHEDGSYLMTYWELVILSDLEWTKYILIMTSLYSKFYISITQQCSDEDNLKADDSHCKVLDYCCKQFSTCMCRQKQGQGGWWSAIPGSRDTRGMFSWKIFLFLFTDIQKHLKTSYSVLIFSSDWWCFWFSYLHRENLLCVHIFK